MPINSTDYKELQKKFNQSDGMAKEIAGLWDKWKMARSASETRAAEAKQFLLATSTRETSNAGKGGVDGDGYDHSVHIPKLTQIADNLSAHYKRSLFSHRNWLDIQGHDDEAMLVEKRKKVTSFLEVKHEMSDFEEVMQQCIDDWILYGNCFARVDFVSEYKMNTDGDPEEIYKGPVVTRINPLDIVFNLQSTSFDKAPKITRELYSLGTLAQMAKADNAPGWVAPALEKALEFRGSLGAYDLAALSKHQQNQLDGLGMFMDYYGEGYVEIIQYHGDFFDISTGTLLESNEITIVDRRYTVHKEKIDTWTGRPLIFHCGWRIRPDTLWAMSPLENLIGMQYLINHLRNGVADATDLIIYPQKVIHGQIDGPEDEFAPGATWYDPEGDGSVDFIRPDTSFLNANFQIDILENQMEAYAGSPKNTMGIRTPGEKTKFEVATLQESALGIFQHRITYFENNFLRKVINAEIEVAVENIGKDTIRIIDDDDQTAEFVKITSKDLRINGTIIPVGAKHFVEKSQKLQELQGTINMLAADPEVRMHFSSVKMAEEIEDALGYDQQALVQSFIRIEEQMIAIKKQNEASNHLVREEEERLDAEERELDQQSATTGQAGVQS